MVYGKSSGGQGIAFPQRPSLVSQAKVLALARAHETCFGRAIIVPDGWELRQRKTQVMIELPKTATPQFRRVFGFVGACTEDNKSRGPNMGFMFSIVLKLPFFFACSQSACEENGEFHCSRVWTRVLAFSNLFCGRAQYNPFRDGEPVVGVIESTTPKKGEKHPSAMLVGWGFASYQE